MGGACVRHGKEVHEGVMGDPALRRLLESCGNR